MQGTWPLSFATTSPRICAANGDGVRPIKHIYKIITGERWAVPANAHTSRIRETEPNKYAQECLECKPFRRLVKGIFSVLPLNFVSMDCAVRHHTHVWSEFIWIACLCCELCGSCGVDKNDLKSGNRVTRAVTSCPRRACVCVCAWVAVDTQAFSMPFASVFHSAKYVEQFYDVEHFILCSGRHSVFHFVSVHFYVIDFGCLFGRTFVRRRRRRRRRQCCNSHAANSHMCTQTGHFGTNSIRIYWSREKTSKTFSHTKVHSPIMTS